MFIVSVNLTSTMIKQLTQASILAALLNTAPAEVVLGGDPTTDVTNWTTSSVAFDDTVQSGHSLNWENVITNTVVVDTDEDEFRLTWEAGVDHTVGHLFMYNEAIDLATLADGIERLYWVAEFETTAFANWSPVISITDGGTTRYYRWNHSANDWSGQNSLNFAAPFNNENPYLFDLSQLGNGTNAATGIWGELQGTATNFAETRDNPTGPNLQAASGEIRFGFLQWTSSATAALDLRTFTTEIECFEVIVNSDPGMPPVVEIGGDVLPTAIAAGLEGELTTFGTDFSNVTVYYGTTDGGTDPGAWENSTPVGIKFCDFTAEITGLTRNTTYFFRLFAQNSAGSDWSDTTETFTTLSATSPSVAVTAGNSTSPVSANFTGNVTDTGNENPTITIFYGTTDEGTNAGSWDASLDLGAQAATFTGVVDDLQSETLYFYRAFAENSAGGAWSPTTESVTTLAFDGVSTSLGSEEFDLRYEMDENPGDQNLDGAGGVNDWFPTAAQATGVDREMLIPQTYADGIASSNQAAGVPEALFRTDFGGSVSRESLSGSFTVEVAVKLKAGTIGSPEFDLGGFGIFLNPGGQPALRLNIDENKISTGLGDSDTTTGSNTDSFHLFRVAYVEADRRYWVWRDGFLLYGGADALPGTEASIFGATSFFLGDFAADLSGDWEVDYIRLHNEAVAPTGVIGNLAVTGTGFVNPITFFIDFQGRPNASYDLKSSTNLTGFATEENPNPGAAGDTDENGIGRFEVNVAGRVPGNLFFRVEADD